MLNANLALDNFWCVHSFRGYYNKIYIYFFLYFNFTFIMSDTLFGVF